MFGIDLKVGEIYRFPILKLKPNNPNILLPVKKQKGSRYMTAYAVLTYQVRVFCVL